METPTPIPTWVPVASPEEWEGGEEEVRALRVGEGEEEVEVGLGVGFMVEEEEEGVGVGGGGPDGLNRSRILLLLTSFSRKENAFDGTCERINSLINHMDNPIRNNPIHTRDPRGINKHLPLLHRNRDILPLHRPQTRPIRKQGTIPHEARNDMVFKQRFQIIRRPIDFDSVRGIRERDGGIGNEVCDVGHFDDPVDVACVGGVEVAADIEDRGEVF